VDGHPVNLAARFVLELSALLILGVWGWHQADGGLRIVLALAIPIVAAALWGTFAVPNDPSRSGSAPVPVSGVVRLALEFGFFGVATVALYRLSFVRLSALFAAALVLHYLLSYDRLRWLVRQ
jgi:uncharacterized protein DUF2568